MTAHPTRLPLQSHLHCTAAIMVALGSLMLVLAGGCGPRRVARLAVVPLEAPLATLVDLEGTAGRVSLTGAGGEWLDFVAVQSGDAVTLRVGFLRRSGAHGTVPAQRIAMRAYEVAELPANTNRAAYVRLYGGDGQRKAIPRALLPLATDAAGRAILPRETPAKLWIDLELPRGLERGEWRTQLEALDAGGEVLAVLPVQVWSHGFDLPVQRRLVVSAPLPWDLLLASWPDTFRGVGPTLLSRTLPRSAPAVARLDELVKLAQQHRLQVTVPALGGTVKWPAGRPPETDWRDYDSTVLPWLTGSAFVDGVGLSNWPVPRMSHLDAYSEAARLEYWQAALAHLADVGTIDRTVLYLRQADAGRDADNLRRDPGLSPVERLRLSREAGKLATATPLGRLAVPLEADQVRFSGEGNPDLYPPEHAGRLMIRAEGLVTDRPDHPWPAGLAAPLRFVDLTGPTPVVMPGPGARESDVRLLGWLAFLRGAVHVESGPALPDLTQPEADPTQLVWFYPGELFGMDQAVPSVQLKWLRRAQQDYEYLAAAADRLEETYVRVIARALVRPVRVAPGEAVDPVLPLLTGDPDPQAWRDGLTLVAEKVAMADEQLRRHLPSRFGADHTNRTTAWLSPRERPRPLVSATRWDLTENARGEQRLHLRLDASIYNPSDARPEGMSLSIVEMPGGESPGGRTWSDPGTLTLPPVATYEVGRSPIATSVGVDQLGQQFRTFTQAPLRLGVSSAFTGATATTSAVAPAVVLDRRQEAPVVDGALGDWSGNEAIADGPLVLMHDRPALQAGEVEWTTDPVRAFVAWLPEGLYIAFQVEDAATQVRGPIRSSRNFVETEYRRAWGEEVCELLIQPVWLTQGDPTDGPLLHVVCKPDTAFAQRRVDRRSSAELWRNFESGMRYAATLDQVGTWRAEVFLPWSALGGDPGPGGNALTAEVPALLRFNLAQHDPETGRSASWAGPVDFGRDEQFTGALVLRRPEPVGVPE